VGSEPWEVEGRRRRRGGGRGMQREAASAVVRRRRSARGRDSRGGAGEDRRGDWKGKTWDWEMGMRLRLRGQC